MTRYLTESVLLWPTYSYDSAVFLHDKLTDGVGDTVNVLHHFHVSYKKNQIIAWLEIKLLRKTAELQFFNHVFKRVCRGGNKHQAEVVFLIQKMEGHYCAASTDIIRVGEELFLQNTWSHRCQPSSNRDLAYFPHFCENVPHFWLYFEIKKIAENRNNFSCRPTETLIFVRESSAKMSMIASPSSTKVTFDSKIRRKSQ